MIHGHRNFSYSVKACLGVCILTTALAEKPSPYQPHNAVPIWPSLAPEETSNSTGQIQAFRAGENPPVMRIEKITTPLLQVFPAPSPNSGTAILILPGGGFGKVVTNKEGSEAATWLNQIGITAFVLSYRTSSPQESRTWFRPLQDSQRGIRYLRHHARKYRINPQRIGLLGFSAGGQVAAIHLADTYPSSYDAMDEIDTRSHYPDFGLLIYPWNTLKGGSESLKPEFKLSRKAPPTFLVHTDDDQSSSLGTLALYAALKRQGTPAELHIYQNGGHGYGMRSVTGSEIGTWPHRAAAWLRLQTLTR